MLLVGLLTHISLEPKQPLKELGAVEELRETLRLTQADYFWCPNNELNPEEILAGGVSKVAKV